MLEPIGGSPVGTPDVHQAVGAKEVVRFMIRHSLARSRRTLRSHRRSSLVTPTFSRVHAIGPYDDIPSLRRKC